MKTKTVAALLKEVRADAARDRRDIAARVSRANAAKTTIGADLAIVNRIAKGFSLSAWLNGEALFATCYVTVDSFVDDVAKATVIRRCKDARLLKPAESDYTSEYTVEKYLRYELPNGGALKITLNLRDPDAEGGTCRRVAITEKKEVETTRYVVVCDQ